MKKYNDTLRKKMVQMADEKQFIYGATFSLGWIDAAEKSFRAAELLSCVSFTAFNKWWTRNLKEINDGLIEKKISVDEYIEMIDSSQIRIAYFLLARSLELLIKGILIEENFNKYYDPIKKQFKIGNIKNEHDLLALAKEAKIKFSLEQENKIKLLNIFPLLGTYPIPKSMHIISKSRELREIHRKDLSYNEYENVSELYDFLLEIYNQKAALNNRQERKNLLKVKKEKIILT